MRLVTARAVRNLLGGGLVCILFACGETPAPEAADMISREAFVDTYVELRQRALRSPDGRISPSARDEVLEAKGVTEADLIEFVDAYGERVPFMVEVWAEIDDSLRSLRTQETTPAS